MYGDLGFQPPFAALLAIASATRTLRVGPACANPFLTHPFALAAEHAVLDQFSGGRAYLGLARGAWLDTIGVVPARPVRALEEAIVVIRRLLAGDRNGFAGAVFRLAPGAGLAVVPLRDSLEVLVGTWGPKTATMARRLDVDEVKVGGCANPYMVRQMAEWVGASVRVVAGAVTVVDEDAALARRLARREVAAYLEVVGPLDATINFPAELAARLGTLCRAGRVDEAAALIPDDLLNRFCFAGTPDDIASHAEELFDAGASRVEFGTPHGVDGVRGIELLGQRVLPRLHAL